MNGSKWASSATPRPMLKFIAGKATQRKLRLFACGCCRQIWDEMTLAEACEAVELAESFADGSVSDRQLEQELKRFETAFELVFHQNMPEMVENHELKTRTIRLALAIDTALPSPFPLKNLINIGDDAFLRSVGPALLRDIFGNPFCPVAVNPAWLAWNGGTVVALARTIYEDRRWDLMPILGDALEDAGCDSEAMLAHCRGEGPHVRGCWVVDLLLGKE